MRASEFFGAVRRLPLATRSQLTRDAPFVVLSPHPDDETLGTGGLIRQACVERQRVDVIVLTDGAGSHTNSVKFPTPRLIQLRKKEVVKAASILGLPSSQIHHLNLPDSHAPMAGRLFDDAVASVARIIAAHNAKTLFVTWGGDPHCDHQAAAAIAKAVLERCNDVALFAYPIWGWHLDTTHEVGIGPQGYRLKIANELEAKIAAIMAHKSQMSDLIDDDPTGFRFNDSLLSPFLQPHEFFILHK